jgi:molybdopterin synthase sulfur carrier subunit
MINVKVRAYAGLGRYLSGLTAGVSMEITVPHGATIGALLDQVGIPRAETKLCFVGSLHREQDYVLSEGDEVALFPPVGGGSRIIGAH